jgi:hypothetical protein
VDGTDGQLPDLDDLAGLEAVVIPALEGRIAEMEMWSGSWVCAMTMLATIRNRLLLIHRVEAVEARLHQLEHITLPELTDDAIARIVAKILAGVRVGE